MESTDITIHANANQMCHKSWVLVEQESTLVCCSCSLVFTMSTGMSPCKRNCIVIEPGTPGQKINLGDKETVTTSAWNTCSSSRTYFFLPVDKSNSLEDYHKGASCVTVHSLALSRQHLCQSFTKTRCDSCFPRFLRLTHASFLAIDFLVLTFFV